MNKIYFRLNGKFDSMMTEETGEIMARVRLAKMFPKASFVSLVIAKQPMMSAQEAAGIFVRAEWDLI